MDTNGRTLKPNMLLLLTAVLWGFAFVAQRAGMRYVEPFIFNGVRFALGSASLLPFIIINRRRRNTNNSPSTSMKILIIRGGLAGSVLFVGSSLQQVGIVYTTAGKAGFITGLYVIIVPILGLFWRQRPDIATWGGAVLATAGLYLLSVTEDFTISTGDLLVLISAFFWAIHVHIIGWLSVRTDPIKLASLQYFFCSVLSLIVAVFAEVISIQGLFMAVFPILYGGFVSVGIAYTLQVVAQRRAHPAYAAIILSLETVFAALGGWIILGESLSSRGLAGCALMFAGMLLSQINVKSREAEHAR